MRYVLLDYRKLNLCICIGTQLNSEIGDREKLYAVNLNLGMLKYWYSLLENTYHYLFCVLSLAFPIDGKVHSKNRLDIHKA